MLDGLNNAISSEQKEYDLKKLTLRSSQYEDIATILAQHKVKLVISGALEDGENTPTYFVNWKQTSLKKLEALKEQGYFILYMSKDQYNTLLTNLMSARILLLAPLTTKIQEGEKEIDLSLHVLDDALYLADAQYLAGALEYSKHNHYVNLCNTTITKAGLKNIYDHTKHKKLHLCIADSTHADEINRLKQDNCTTLYISQKQYAVIDKLMKKDANTRLWWSLAFSSCSAILTFSMLTDDRYDGSHLIVNVLGGILVGSAYSIMIQAPLSCKRVFAGILSTEGLIACTHLALMRLPVENPTVKMCLSGALVLGYVGLSTKLLSSDYLADAPIVHR